jgi:hypothetical protein
VKKLFGKLITVVLLVVPFISGCGFKTESQDVGSDIRVQIPVVKNAQPSFEVVTLKGVNDFSSLSGRHAIFYYAPKIDGHDVEGSRPKARFMKSADGVFIPTDSQSAEMASIYYHLQNLAAFNEQVGIGELNRPLKVALSTRIQRGSDWIHDSAFYDNNADTMIFVDFSLQVLPLTINPGVIAHEYFHSIFSKILLTPLIQKGFISEDFNVKTTRPPDDTEDSERGSKDKELKSFLTEYLYFKALNEGLADFWGWAYSGDENFVARSLPDQVQRNLKSSVRQKISDLDFSFGVEAIMRKYHGSGGDIHRMQDEISDISYGLGTQYARFFRHLVTDSEGRELTGQAKIDQIKTVVGLIKELQRQYVLEKSKDTLVPERVIERYRQINPEIAKSHCQQFSAVINGAECAP